MKPHGSFILLSLMSIATFGQEAQSPSNPSDHPASPSTQSAPTDQPFLHSQVAGTIQANQSRTENGTDDLHGELESLKTYLGGRRGLIEIPPSAAAGWWEGMGDSSVRFLDDRGNSLPDAWGNITRSPVNGFRVGYANGLLLRATETDPSSPDRYTGFMNMQFHYTAAQGGMNNLTEKSGTKTDYINVLATSEMRTVGQKSGIASHLASYSSGDTMGIQTNVTQFGGDDTYGDEQTEGVRIQIQQGFTRSMGTGGIFQGVVDAISGKTFTYKANHDENTLGEHRLIRDLDRSYSAGSILSIINSGGTRNSIRVTGSNTHWSELGLRAHTSWNDIEFQGGVSNTNLTFCFEPLKTDGYDTCFPISEIVDDTHLTLNLIAYGTESNTPWPSEWPSSGEYRIYGAAWPTTVDLATHTIAAPDLSGIAAGHRIDQVLAYSTQTIGQWIAVSRHIGIPGKGGGIYIANWGTAQSPGMGYGIAVSGGFETGFAFQNSNARSGVPNYFAKFFSEPASKIIFDSTVARTPAPEVALWRLRDAKGAAHVMLSFLRETATTCVLDTSLCVSARGSVAARSLGQVEGDDYAGTISIDGGSSAKVNFRQPFQSNPVCTLTPTSDPTEIGAYWVSTSPSSVTASVRHPGRIVFNFVCVGNPD
jgi:hypothetical protein